MNNFSAFFNNFLQILAFHLYSSSNGTWNKEKNLTVPQKNIARGVPQHLFSDKDLFDKCFNLDIVTILGFFLRDE